MHMHRNNNAHRIHRITLSAHRNSVADNYIGVSKLSHDGSLLSLAESSQPSPSRSFRHNIILYTFTFGPHYSVIDYSLVLAKFVPTSCSVGEDDPLHKTWILGSSKLIVAYNKKTMASEGI